MRWGLPCTFLAAIAGPAPAQASVVDDLFERARAAETRREPERAAALARRALAALQYSGDRANRELEETAIRDLLGRVDPLAASARTAYTEAAAALTAAAEQMRGTGWTRTALRLALAAQPLDVVAVTPLVTALRQAAPKPAATGARRWGDPVPSATALTGKEGELARWFSDAICPDPFADDWALQPHEFRSPPGRESEVLTRSRANPTRIRVDVALGGSTLAGIIFGMHSPEDYHFGAVHCEPDGTWMLAFSRYAEQVNTTVGAPAKIPAAAAGKDWLTLELTLTDAGAALTLGTHTATTATATRRTAAGGMLGFRAIGVENGATSVRFRNLVIEEAP